jgi:hypothetical protein
MPGGCVVNVRCEIWFQNVENEAELEKSVAGGFRTRQEAIFAAERILDQNPDAAVCIVERDQDDHEIDWSNFVPDGDGIFVHPDRLSLTEIYSDPTSQGELS